MFQRPLHCLEVQPLDAMSRKRLFLPSPGQVGFLSLQLSVPRHICVPRLIAAVPANVSCKGTFPPPVNVQIPQRLLNESFCHPRAGRPLPPVNPRALDSRVMSHLVCRSTAIPVNRSPSVAFLPDFTLPHHPHSQFSYICWLNEKAEFTVIKQRFNAT